MTLSAINEAGFKVEALKDAGMGKNEDESEVAKDRGREKKEPLCHLGVGFGPMVAANEVTELQCESQAKKRAAVYIQALGLQKCCFCAACLHTVVFD